MNNGASVNGFGEGVATAPDLRRTIPFEYAFRYELKGQPGLVQNSTVDISIEAAFTAVSIGYGVVPKVQPVTFGLPLDEENPPKTLRNIKIDHLLTTLSRVVDEEFGTIGPRTAAVLNDGFRLNPQFADRILLSEELLLPVDDEQILSAIFQTVGAPPERVAFKYALFDQGSGREFQSEPILNIAGLGSADGKRPFRYFARPIEFAPRSSIRLQVTEVSAFQGELHVSLQGYKALGTRGTSTAPSRASRIRRMRR
jgi:hypothetical protein